MHRQHRRFDLAVEGGVVLDVVAGRGRCVNVRARVHLRQPTIDHRARNTQRIQVSSLRRREVVVVIHVLHKWATGTALQLRAKLGEKSEICKNPAGVERGRWRRCNTTPWIACDQPDKLKFREVGRYADFAENFGEKLALKINIVPNFTNRAPRGRGSKDNVVSEVKRQSSVPDAS